MPSTSCAFSSPSMQPRPINQGVQAYKPTRHWSLHFPLFLEYKVTFGTPCTLVRLARTTIIPPPSTCEGCRLTPTIQSLCSVFSSLFLTDNTTSHSIQVVATSKPPPRTLHAVISPNPFIGLVFRSPAFVPQRVRQLMTRMKTCLLNIGTS